MNLTRSDMIGDGQHESTTEWKEYGNGRRKCVWTKKSDRVDDYNDCILRQ